MYITIQFMMRILAMLIVCMTTACSVQGQPTREVKLPSGKIVNVIGVGQISFSNDSPALMLKYQTGLKITDTVALRKEVDEIWESFEAEVEQAKVRCAIVSANEIPRGVLFKTASGYNFVFTKQPDGSWRCMDDEPKQKQSKEKEAEKKR
jgi:hypothetical protein